MFEVEIVTEVRFQIMNDISVIVKKKKKDFIGKKKKISELDVIL